MAYTKVFKFASTLRFPSKSINTRTIPGCVTRSVACWCVYSSCLENCSMTNPATAKAEHTHTHIVIDICFVHPYIKNKRGVHKTLRKGPTHLHTKMQPQIQIKV